MEHSGNLQSIRKFRLARLVLTVLFALALFANVASAAPAQSPAWQLMDYNQSACFDTNVTTSYYGIWINGAWTHTVRIGITSLPGGSTSWTSYAPIRPGSSDGIYSLAYVGIQIPSNTPVGTYTASLWASDGRSRQTVPVTLNVKSTCGY